MTKQLLTAVTLLSLSTAAYATLDCQGKIDNVLLSDDGAVNVLTSWREDYMYICNLKTERQGVSVATCASWSSMLLKIKETGADANFYYDSIAGLNSCETIPIHSNAPAPTGIEEV